MTAPILLHANTFEHGDRLRGLGVSITASAAERAWLPACLGSASALDWDTERATELLRQRGWTVVGQWHAITDPAAHRGEDPGDIGGHQAVIERAPEWIAAEHPDATSEPMSPAVLDDLRSLPDHDLAGGPEDDESAALFRLDERGCIRAEGRRAARFVLVRVPGHGLYVRYATQSIVRARTDRPSRDLWTTRALRPVAAGDDLEIARTIHRLLTEHAA